MSGPIGLEFDGPNTALDCFAEALAEGKTVREAAVSTGHGSDSANFWAKQLADLTGEQLDPDGH